MTPIIVTGEIGLILSECFNHAENLIDQAGNRADLSALKAGIELRKTIEHARIAYSGSLNKTMDRVDVSTRDAIIQIATVAERVQTRNEILLKILTHDAQMLVNALPFSNGCPQLISFSPRYVVVTDPAKHIHFNCFGNFVHAVSNMYPHTLQFKDKKADLITNMTTRLIFKIAAKDIVDMNVLHASNTYSFSTALLSASWPGPTNAPSIGRIVRQAFGRKQPTPAPVAFFRITVGVLPSSPGVITLKYKTFKWIREERTHVSEPKHLDSCQMYAIYIENERKSGYQHEVMNFTEMAADGWTIKPGSVSTVPIILTLGRASLEFVGATEKAATFRAETKKKSWFKVAGIIDFLIRFTEWRNRRVEDQNISLNIPLGWTEQHTFTPTRDWDEGWTVSFKPFDSDTTEDFTQAIMDHDRILIERDAGGGFKIKPKIPAELDDNF